MGHAESKVLEPPVVVAEDDLPQARIVAVTDDIDRVPSPQEERFYNESIKSHDIAASLAGSIAPSVLKVPLLHRHPMSDYDFKKTLYE